MILTKENYSEYVRKTYASWLGKNIGIRLGAPVENWSSEKIEELYHGKTGYLVDYDIFASDDDSNGPLFFVRAMLNRQTITPKEIGDTFLAYLQQYQGFFWWGGVGVSSEHTAYENLKNGINAPASGSIAQNGLTIAEQIGGQIFSDCWGYIAGGDGSLAASLAEKASSVTHDGNGIEGGKFVASAIAYSYTCTDVKEVIQKALTHLHKEMAYYQAVQVIMDFYQQHPQNWRDCLTFIQENYGYDRYPGVCHIIPNTCVMIMGMLYGENDFSKTLTIINQSGWDTDCNCGNVGSIMGALVGIEGIDSSWITPINDVVNASSCIGYLNIQHISTNSKLFARIAYQLKGIEIQDDEKFDLPYATNGFRSDGPVEVKDRGLIIKGHYVYNYSYYLGEDLYDSRYDPSFSPLVYPNDTLYFKLAGKGLVRVFVEDCQGNLEFSEPMVADQMISYQIKTGVNKTIRRYGLEKLSSDDLLMMDYGVNRCPKLDLDFANYPIDEYGPRYAGDTLSNLRGFVVHSGQFDVSEKGLHFYGEQAGLMSTLTENKLKSATIEFEGDHLMFVYDMKDYQNYKAVGIQQGHLVSFEKKNGIKESQILDKIYETNHKYIFNLYNKNDTMFLFFRGHTFLVAKNVARGIIGFCSEVPYQVWIQSLALETVPEK